MTRNMFQEQALEISLIKHHNGKKAATRLRLHVFFSSYYHNGFSITTLKFSFHQIVSTYPFDIWFYCISTPPLLSHYYRHMTYISRSLTLPHKWQSIVKTSSNYFINRCLNYRVTFSHGLIILFKAMCSLFCSFRCLYRPIKCQNISASRNPTN